jgi:hypothetical protein
MNDILDYVVVGSGCSGAIAAQTLIEGGANVLMIDVGVQDDSLRKLIPGKDYLTIRKTDKNQSKYLIGPHGEGIAWGRVGKGAQVTPPRQYMTKDIGKYIPTDSDTFSPLESLAYGGLGVGWGLQCWEYSDNDLAKTGLNTEAIRQAYSTVSARIGISASKDEATKYTIGTLDNFQPSADADRNHRYIQSRYKKQAAALQSRGLYVGRTPLALITKNLGERKGHKYRDMDFYADDSNSSWRPWMTVNTLKKNRRFTYKSGLLLVRFEEKKDVVHLFCINTKNDTKVEFKCRKLVLASGALGSARIALRSLGDASSRTPILSNPHTYMPCVVPAMLGKGSEKHKLGFGQLSYFLDNQGDDAGLSVASSYSYQSLMLFRTIGQIPFNFADAKTISRYLLPGLVIMILQHPDSQSPDKYVKLANDPTSPTGDKLIMNYKLSDQDAATWSEREKKYITLLRKLRTYAVKRVDPGHGSSVHYAGTLPFSNKQKKLHLSPAGRLHGTKHVYAADSSGFLFLPAKGLTFTLMANAHVTAENILNGKN